MSRLRNGLRLSWRLRVERAFIYRLAACEVTEEISNMDTNLYGTPWPRLGLRMFTWAIALFFVALQVLA